MKTLKYFIILTVAFVTTLQLQAGPKRLPVGSLRELWRYNAQQIRGGYVQAQGRNILEAPENITYVPFTYVPKNGVVDVAEVNKLIKESFFRFQTIKPEDGFPAATSIEDGLSRTLFYGGEHVDTTPKKAGNYTMLPKKIKTRIADKVYFPYPGARYAYFIEEDAQGNFLRNVEIPVENGWLVWPTGYTTNLREKGDWDEQPQQGLDDQKFGEVRVTVRDESGYHDESFNLRNGGERDLGDIIEGNGVEGQMGGILPWPVNNKQVRYTVEESNAVFTGQLFYTKQTTLVIYPAQGTLVGSEKIAAESYRFKLMDAAGNVVTPKEFSQTTWDNPYTVTLPGAMYYLEFEGWSSLSFGQNYFPEWHWVPNPDDDHEIGTPIPIEP